MAVGVLWRENPAFSNKRTFEQTNVEVRNSQDLVFVAVKRLLQKWK